MFMDFRAGVSCFGIANVCFEIEIELPEIEHIVSFMKYGVSTWAITFRIDALLQSGSEQSYFLKVSSLPFIGADGNRITESLPQMTDLCRLSLVRSQQATMVTNLSKANTNPHWQYPVLTPNLSPSPSAGAPTPSTSTPIFTYPNSITCW